MSRVGLGAGESAGLVGLLSGSGRKSRLRCGMLGGPRLVPPIETPLDPLLAEGTGDANPLLSPLPLALPVRLAVRLCGIERGEPLPADLSE